MKYWKVLIVAAVAIASAGCRAEGTGGLAGPTQATFGRVNPAVPQGWVKQVRPGGVIAFTCPDTSCRERGEIAYSEMAGSSDLEAAIRAKGPGYLRAMGNELAKASGGELRQVGFKDMSNADIIRFERVMTKKTRHGAEYYIMHRTVKGGRSRIVSATAPTLAKAWQYMKIGLASFP